ncbi:hypothetical protein [Streptomyces millisiae]|uniref:ATP-binding protein n=1 Tax=Streptomyces millisiae TaxID=3075542 RepID=A0ABU2LLA8_9ACTN|nr:hypothetical protein [Streptomyces sp. DSM 44918]MDT0318027.1 hypothetical protein [Streptomyces sp. DSM 44918]
MDADVGSDLVVDARRLRFASPLDLAAIAALTHKQSAAGGEVELVLPADARVASYVQRMDLIARLPAEAQVVGHLPFDDRQDRASALLETSPLTPETAGAVGERIGQLAKASLGAGNGARVSRSIGELIDNAISHGLGPSGAFIAAQTYTGRTTRYRRLEVAICDTGIGVLRHLRQNPEHKNVATSTDALQRALEPGVSGTTEQRGNGLPDLLAHAGARGPARLVLRSGDGLLHAGRQPRSASVPRRQSSPTWVEGTWAWLRVSFTP